MTRIDDRFEQGGYGIVLEGADKFLKELKAVAPDLSKELKKRLEAIGNRIIADAKTRVPGESPLSHWGREPKDPAAWHAKYNKNGRVRQRPGGFPHYDAGKIKAGLKAQTGKPKGAKFGGVLYLTNRDAAGSILEVTGRRREPSNKSGAHFIATLNAIDSASRVIWDAYDDAGRKKIQAEVIATVQDIEAEFERRFGGEGFGETRR